MSGLYLLLPAFLTIIASFLVIRAGAIALMMTGMNPQKANFQALSAFSRAGFTTKESELVLNNPRRRRIISWLIIIGNAGLIAIIVTTTSSITTSEGYQVPLSIIGLVLGTYLLYLLARHTGLTRRWEGFIQNRLVKSRAFEETTTEDLLHLIEGYGVVRIMINPGSPFAGKSIRESFPPDSQLWIVGIERGREWISLPKSRELMKEGDRLVVYGNLNVFKRVFK